MAASLAEQRVRLLKTLDKSLRRINSTPLLSESCHQHWQRSCRYFDKYYCFDQDADYLCVHNELEGIEGLTLTRWSPTKLSG